MGFETGDGGTAGSGTMLTPQRAVITDTLGALTTSITTATEISYVSGVTSSIQTQLNGKQPTGNYITALTGDVSASGPGSVTATIQPGAVDNGKVAVGAAIARSKLASGTANHVLINDAGGVMSSEAQLALSRGGTNKNNTAVNGGVAYSDATGIAIGAAGTSGQILVSAGAAAPVWTNVSSIATAPTVQRLLSGTGATYNTPAGCKMLKVRMVGGGGGGRSSGTAGQVSGGSGGNTTFGSSLLIANGGSGNTGNAVPGGSVTVNSPAIAIVAVSGAGGEAGSDSGSLTIRSGSGGNSYFGGAGAAVVVTTPGQAAAANSGSGGSGGGITTASGVTGGGGGAGGYIEAWIHNPSSTYTYTIGSGGTGGGAGTGGAAGGAGAAGIIIVEEYYV